MSTHSSDLAEIAVEACDTIVDNSLDKYPDIKHINIVKFEFLMCYRVKGDSIEGTTMINGLLLKTQIIKPKGLYEDNKVNYP